VSFDKNCRSSVRRPMRAWFCDVEIVQYHAAKVGRISTPSSGAREPVIQAVKARKEERCGSCQRYATEKYSRQFYRALL